MNRRSAIKALATGTIGALSIRGLADERVKDQIEAEKVVQKNRTNDDSFFPLMAWDDVREESTIKKMAEGGINSIAFVPPHLLDVCEKYHVKAILYDRAVDPIWNKPFDSKMANEVLPGIIKKYNSHPAVYGYHLKDEPGGDQLEALGKSCRLIRKLAPGKWPYINLPPGTGDWYDKVFLQAFVDTCKPPILSYDNYPIGEKIEFSWGFWANAWDVRSASLRNQVPFHVIVLASAHWNYRIPTADDLRLQVYGPLAYGARGIGYYKFVSEPLSVLEAPDLGNFHGGPLDEFGCKNITYQLLHNLNRRVSIMAPTLLKLRSDDVYHIGDIPKRNHGIKEDSLIKVMGSGEQFIIGEFTHEDGSRWVMVVNKNLKESTFCRPKFSKEVKSIKYLCPDSGEILPFPAPWYALAPGQGVFLRLHTVVH